MSTGFSEEGRRGTDRLEPRRGARGPERGLIAELPGLEQPVPVVEAGAMDLFVATEALDRFAEGDRFEITLVRGGYCLRCEAEVTGTEAGTRRGVALRLVGLTDATKQAFDTLRLPIP